MEHMRGMARRLMCAQYVAEGKKNPVPRALKFILCPYDDGDQTDA